MTTIKRVFVSVATMAVSATALAQWNADSTEMDTYDHYRVGGYGEMVAQFKNYGINRFNGTSTGNSDVKRNTISIPRFVVAGDYKFNRHWNLGVEIFRSFVAGRLVLRVKIMSKGFGLAVHGRNDAARLVVL